MKRIILAIAGVISGATIVWAGVFYWNNLRGVWPAIKEPRQKIEDSFTAAPENGPLALPVGFSISVFAKNLSGARVLLFDNKGNLWVSQPAQGAVSLLEIENGRVIKQSAVFSGLNNPHGLAFNPDDASALYIAEENKISKTAVYGEEKNLKKIIDLPAGGGHFTRTIGFGPDKRLYVSIGSSCNVCDEKDRRRAKIFSMNKDGRDFKEFAQGLRNSVFFTWHPETKKMWATEMGRDLIGDDIPPDEINIIEAGKNYGWPDCYGKNISDPFSKNIPANLCATRAPSYIDIQAHSAPLGLAFIPQQGWPEDYQNNLLVAYHGSWNRSIPTGYKIVRYRLDEKGNMLGAEDFISGWLKNNEVSGRPVDIIIQPDGAMYISDDKAGVIYRVTYKK
ncbi:MAG: PQQ-dependent sugar dehydrogenase [Parcubacteria group bacterium]|nr:PQQ-dependent sugar dehydrogenase [Parcubacteria group bacterium]